MSKIDSSYYNYKNNSISSDLPMNCKEVENFKLSFKGKLNLEFMTSSKIPLEK